MNVVAYCRVSTDKEDQLNSLEAQKKFFKEYTERNKYNLIEIYADEGISGTKIKKREAFQRLMHDAKKGQFDIVVVKDISRFARNTVDFLQSIRILKALGIETVFLTSNQTVLGNSEFILTIFGALAQEESANTSKRVKFGKKINAKNGRVPNFVYGYDKIKGEYFKMNINPKEAKVVKDIFNMYVYEGFGAAKIAKALNSQNITTKRGCNWSQNAVTRILANEIYIGKVINGKEEIEDFLTGVRKRKPSEDWYISQKDEFAIIDFNTFQRAQEILHFRSNMFKNKNHRENNKHLFSTLIKCEVCGYSFRRFNTKYKNSSVKWICSCRNTKGIESCFNLIKLNEDLLKNSINQYFKSMLQNHKYSVEFILKDFEKIYNMKLKNLDFKKDLKNKLKKLTALKEKYIKMYTEDLISMEDLKIKTKDLNTSIEKAELALKTFENSQKTFPCKEEIIKSKFFSSIDNFIDLNNLDNIALKQLVQKISVNETGRVNIFLKNF